jgi:hypothetical protein
MLSLSFLSTSGAANLRIALRSHELIAPVHFDSLASQIYAVQPKNELCRPLRSQLYVTVRDTIRT